MLCSIETSKNKLKSKEKNHKNNMGKESCPLPPPKKSDLYVF